MPAIGFVSKQQDGSYKGELMTLTIQTSLEIRPVSTKDDERHPDYRIYANNVEIGTARKKVGKGGEYIALSLAIPEFGPKRLTANLGRAAGQDDQNFFAIIWNPED